MKKVKTVLLNNLGLKIISLILAFFIWFIVVQANNPTDSKTFTNIQVNIINTEIFDSNNQVYSVVDRSNVVSVVVRAPKTVLSTLSASDIVAEADANDLVDGEIAISYSVPGSNSVESVTGNRETVKITLEDKARRYIRLATNYIGEPAEGYLIGDITADQNMIEITGPKSSVDNVSSAAVTIDVSNANLSLSANVEIELYDSDGNEINDSSITKQVDYVHVNVEVYDTKSVIIYASKIGTPAEGYLYTGNIDISPAMVSIAGLSENLSSVSRILISDAIDISGATESVTREVNINEYLPENIMFTDSEFDGIATVTVYIEPIAYKNVSLDASKISIVNLPEGYSAQILYPTDTFSINLSGLQEELDKLSDEEISSSIDISAWMVDENIEELEDGTVYIPIDITASGSVAAAGTVNTRVMISKD